MSVLLIFTLAACTTMQPITGDLTKENITNVVKPGNEIVIFTKTGYQHSIKVSSVTEDYIIGAKILEEEHQYLGEEEQFKLEDIERIDTRKPSAAAKVGGTAAAGGAIILLYAVSYAIVTVFIFEIVGALAF